MQVTNLTIRRISSDIIVEWLTDEPSDSRVEYVYNKIINNIYHGDLVYKHSIIINNIQKEYLKVRVFSSTDYNNYVSFPFNSYKIYSPSGKDITPPEIRTNLDNIVTNNHSTLTLNINLSDTESGNYVLQYKINNDSEVIIPNVSDRTDVSFIPIRNKNLIHIKALDYEENESSKILEFISLHNTGEKANINVSESYNSDTSNYLIQCNVSDNYGIKTIQINDVTISKWSELLTYPKNYNLKEEVELKDVETIFNIKVNNILDNISEKTIQVFYDPYITIKGSVTDTNNKKIKANLKFFKDDVELFESETDNNGEFLNKEIIYSLSPTFIIVDTPKHKSEKVQLTKSRKLDNIILSFNTQLEEIIEKKEIETIIKDDKVYLQNTTNKSFKVLLRAKNKFTNITINDIQFRRNNTQNNPVVIFNFKPGEKIEFDIIYLRENINGIIEVTWE